MHDSPSVSSRLRQITRVPRPERHDERAQVARACGGDREAIDLLISANLACVVHIGKELRSRGLPFEDVIAEGCARRSSRRFRTSLIRSTFPDMLESTATTPPGC